MSDLFDKTQKAAQDKLVGTNPTSTPGASGKGGGALERKTTEIVPERWNQLHVYSFSINNANKNGSCSNSKQKEQPLNLAPQAISISTPFAMAASATNRGVLEESNGIVFRMINISGTTGLYPLRETLGGSSAVSSSFTSVAPKTGQAVDTLLKRVATSGTSKPSSSSNTNLEETGYYQFWALNNFLIEYAEKKKTRDGKSIRLVFNCPKDNISYVCTPISFDLRRSAESPLLYYYSISLKCWDVTTDAGSVDKAFEALPSKDNVGVVSSTLDRIRKSRNTIKAASNVLKAVYGDVNSVLNIYNQGVLNLKDVTKTVREVQDMPDIIKNNAQNTFKNNKLGWKEIVQDKINKKQITVSKNPFTAETSGSTSGKGTKLAQDVHSGMSSKAISALNGAGSHTNPDGSTPAKINEEVSPEAIQIIYQIADDPILSEGITLDQLGTFSKAMQDQIDKRIQDSLALTPGDIRRQCNQLKQVSDNLAYGSGMMDATYAKTYGLRVPSPDEMKEPSEQDIILQAAVEEARDAFLTTLASGDMYGAERVNPFEVANKSVQDNDRISTPSSAFPAPVNRGSTMEQIAIQYLGDATRARDIVLLNDLRSPFIDEDGFDQTIKNCTGRTFIVNNTEKLAIKQSIRIMGVNVPTTRRTIINIEDIGAGEYRVSVDGSPDLNQYDASKQPKLFARLPGTVGSGDVLLIPSDQPADNQNNLRSTPLTERLSYAEKVFKVDFALDPVTSDLVVSASGDIARSYGYANAIQAIRLIIETERQELYLHPDYGIDLKIGKAITTEIYKEITQRVRAAIVKDPRFNNATVDVRKEGTAVIIKVEVIGSNGTGRIPLEFQFPV